MKERNLDLLQTGVSVRQYEVEEKKKKIEQCLDALPTLDETTYIPWNTKNPFLQLLAAAVIGLLSAVPVVLIVWQMGMENCSGSPVLFSAFAAIMLQQVLSRFAFPANIERGFSHGLATMLLIGQVLAAYLFFLETAFYGATALVTAVLISIPVCGRIVMFWQAKHPNAWFLTILGIVGCWILFEPFYPETIMLPLHAFWQMERTIAEDSLPLFSSRLIFYFFGTTLLCIFACKFWMRKVENRKSAAMLSSMITELLIWFSLLFFARYLTYVG